MCAEFQLDPYNGQFPAIETRKALRPISAFLITFNEEDRIPSALSSLIGLVDEIVVVDSGSSDRTREIAAAYGARVVVNAPFPGYGPQKRFAEDLCRNDWVLNLDADEALSPELARSIHTAMSQPIQEKAAYRLRIMDLLPGEEQPPRKGYSVSPVRLYRKDHYRYSHSLVHDRVELPANVNPSELDGIILHRSVRSFSAQFKKLAGYSELQTKDAALAGRRIRKRRLVTEFPLSFMRCFLLRRYLLRGLPGFLASVNYAIFRHIRVVQFYELRFPRKDQS